MRIINLTTTDPAGAIMNMVNAVNRYTEHTARLFTCAKAIQQFGFKEDFNIQERVPKETIDEVEWWSKNADVLIIHKPQELGWNKFNLAYTKGQYSHNIPFRQIIKNKRVLYQHHGEPYVKKKENYKEIEFRYQEIHEDLKIIVVTPDLLEIHKKTKYIPNCIPVNDVEYMPRYIDDKHQGYFPLYKKIENKTELTRFICQSPTPTCYKHTDVFEKAFKNLEKKYKNIESMIIAGVSQKDCLRHKRMAYAGFDHMRGWYGLNALEFLSMGIPVLVGMDNNCLESIYGFFWDNDIKKIPVELVHSQEEIEKKLDFLLNDFDYRQNVSKLSRKFMETVWTEKYIANKLIDYIKS